MTEKDFEGKPSLDPDHFWQVRSEHYNELEWATRQEYLETFLKLGDFREKQMVLDVGTGTGLIAETLAPLVSHVIGIDTSKEMLDSADPPPPNVGFCLSDVRSLCFPEETFERVTARMVFHHVLEDTADGMRECFRVLKRGGKLVFSEGVPPHHSIREWYSTMFALKEERLTFLDEELVDLVVAGGFQREFVTTTVHVTPQVSILNWLRNSGLDREVQKQIFEMHIQLDESQRSFYNFALRNGDIFLDMKFVIIVAEKG